MAAAPPNPSSAAPPPPSRAGGVNYSLLGDTLPMKKERKVELDPLAALLGSGDGGSNSREGEEDGKTASQRQQQPMTAAFDPALQSYRSSITTRRRRKVFEVVAPTFSGMAGAAAAGGGTGSTAAPAPPSPERQAAMAEAAEALLDTAGSASSAATLVSLKERQQKFEAAAVEMVLHQQSHSDSQRGSSSSVVSHGVSLLASFLEDGVPDVEEWDKWMLTAPYYRSSALVLHPSSVSFTQGGDIAPRTRDAASAAELSLLHLPVLSDSHYTQHYQHQRLTSLLKQATNSAKGGSGGGGHSAPKTKEERRKEKKERLRIKKEEEKRKKQASGATAAVKDRLHHRNLLVNLLQKSVLNPLGVEQMVNHQYNERYEQHLHRNFERHMDAIPHQLEKRIRDAERRASERPILRCYRIYPIFSAAHLGKLRNMANDQLLRGFIVWTAQVEAIVVLAGGSTAMRHLHRWICEKMVWEYEGTRAHCVCTIPLPDAHLFSFHEKGKRPRSDGEGESEEKDLTAAAQDGSGGIRNAEPVFITFTASVEETRLFLEEKQPAAAAVSTSIAGARSSLTAEPPWADLMSLWRAACLSQYLYSFSQPPVE